MSIFEDVINSSRSTESVERRLSVSDFLLMKGIAPGKPVRILIGGRATIECKKMGISIQKKYIEIKGNPRVSRGKVNLYPDWILELVFRGYLEELRGSIAWKTK
jgi:hypothetical protein